MNHPVLCYIEGPWAWFTTCPLSKQWGDDWDDAPYECNASDPYEWREGRGPKYELIKVAWEGPFNSPAQRGITVSVEKINGGKVAWLQSTDGMKIPAGKKLEHFREIMKAAGGQVYEAHVSDSNALVARLLRRVDKDRAA